MTYEPHFLRKVMPSDFPEHAMDTIANLCARYGVGKNKIVDWRREIGIEGLKTKWTDELKQLVRDNWGVRSTTQIANMIGCDRKALVRQANRMGLKATPKAPARTGWHFDFGPRQFDGRKAKGIADEAADFIRDHDRTCVYRVDKNGKPNPKANFWKYGFGSLVMSEEELIAKAERKGWDRDAWKRLAA